MSYGLLIKKTSTNIVIDSDYKNHHLKEEGIYRVNGSSASGIGTTYINTTNTTAAPLFAFKLPTTAYAQFWGWTKSSTTFTTAKVFCDSFYDLTYRVYWAGPTTSTNGYGLYVRNAAGEGTYHSNDKPLNILNTYSDGFASYTIGATNNITVSDAYNNFFCFQNPGYSFIYNKTSGTTNMTVSGLLCCYGAINSTTIQCKMVLWYNQLVGGFNINDVTNGSISSAAAATILEIKS